MTRRGRPWGRFGYVWPSRSARRWTARGTGSCGGCSPPAPPAAALLIMRISTPEHLAAHPPWARRRSVQSCAKCEPDAQLARGRGAGGAHRVPVSMSDGLRHRVRRRLALACLFWFARWCLLRGVHVCGHFSAHSASHPLLFSQTWWSTCFLRLGGSSRICDHRPRPTPSHIP